MSNAIRVEQIEAMYISEDEEIGHVFIVKREDGTYREINIPGPVELWDNEDVQALFGESFAPADLVEKVRELESKPGLYLPGITGNYVSTPYHANLSITGDIDLRAKISKQVWTSWAIFLGTWTTGGPSTLSYALRQSGTGGAQGRLSLDWNSSGGYRQAVSTVPFIPNPGEHVWVRATLDVDTGVGNHSVIFYTSKDGVVWTQLGAPTHAIQSSAVTNIVPNNVELQVAGNTNSWSGNVYQAQVRSGIDGPIVAEFDATKLQNPYTDSTGKVWTIQGTAWKWIDDSEVGKTLAKPGGASLVGTTSGRSVQHKLDAVKNVQPKPGLYLPGTSGNIIGTTTAIAPSLAGDLDVRVLAHLSTDSIRQTLAGSGRLDGGNNLGGQFTFVYYGDNKRLYFFTWDATGGINYSAFIAYTAPDEEVWFRVTYRASDERVQFFTSPSDDGKVWEQLSVNRTLSGPFAGQFLTHRLMVGNYGHAGANWAKGTFRRAEFRSSIEGTIIANWDASAQTTPYIDSTGKTWAVSGTGWSWVDNSDIGKHLARPAAASAINTTDGRSVQKHVDVLADLVPKPGLYLPGAPNNYVRTNDHNSLDITGSIEIVVRVEQSGLAPAGAIQSIVAKGYAGVYRLLINSAGRLGVAIKRAGQTMGYPISPVDLPLTKGWLKGTWDSITGVSSFFYAPDSNVEPTVWISLGTSLTVPAGTLDTDSSPIILGAATSSGSERFYGTIRRAIIRNGINGTIVADWDGTHQQSPYVDSTGKMWEVVGSDFSWVDDSDVGEHLARPAMAAHLGTADGDSVQDKLDALSSSPGLYHPAVSGNYITTPDHADLDITGDIGFIFAVEPFVWPVPTYWGVVIKGNAYRINLHPDGRIQLGVGVGGTLKWFSSDIIPSVDGGVRFGISVDVNNGAGGHTVQFWQDNRGHWIPVGSSTFTPAIAIDTNADRIESHSPLQGRYDELKIYSGIGANTAPGQGTLVAEFDASKLQNPYTDSTGKVWTVMGDAWKWIEGSEVGANLAKPGGAALIGTKSGLTVENRLVWRGVGSPVGVVSAPPNTEYIDTNSTNGARKWLKTSGSGSEGWRVLYGDTGWITVSRWNTAGVVTGLPLLGDWIPRPGTAGYINMRRVNDMVHIFIVNLAHATFIPAGTAKALINIPGIGDTWTAPMGGSSAVLGTESSPTAIWTLRYYSDQYHLLPGYSVGAGGLLAGSVGILFQSSVLDRLWPITFPTSV